MNIKELTDLTITALEDLKGVDIKSIDVREMTDVTDQIVICTGTSSRHIKALADNLATMAKEAGLKPLGVEGERGSDWILVDLGDLVAHVMLPQARDFYHLETLWEHTKTSRDDHGA